MQFATTTNNSRKFHIIPTTNNKWLNHNKTLPTKGRRLSDLISVELFDATIGSRRNSSIVASRRSSATMDTLLSCGTKVQPQPQHAHSGQPLPEHEEAYVSLALHMNLQAPDTSKVEIFHHGQYLGIKLTNCFRGGLFCSVK